MLTWRWASAAQTEEEITQEYVAPGRQEKHPPAQRQSKRTRLHALPGKRFAQVLPRALLLEPFPKEGTRGLFATSPGKASTATP